MAGVHAIILFPVFAVCSEMALGALNEHAGYKLFKGQVSRVRRNYFNTLCRILNAIEEL
jgi:hypothetical protein